MAIDVSLFSSCLLQFLHPHLIAAHNLLKLTCHLWYNVAKLLTFSKRKERGLINKPSDKQEMIKRMIGRQYDQLLEMCNQTKVEIDELNRNLKDSDFVQRLEIEKIQALIFSIEHEVQTKKQEIYNSEIKNRYQQLTTLYQQTKDEVRLLESTLESNIQKVDQNQRVTSRWLNDDEIRRNPIGSDVKRERLDLSTPTESQCNDAHYEGMVKKWHESLKKIDALEEQQQLLNTLESPVSNVEPLPLVELVPIQPEEEMMSISDPVVEEEESADLVPPRDVLKAEAKVPDTSSVVQVEPEIPMLSSLPVAPEVSVMSVEGEAPELEEQVEGQDQLFPAGEQKPLTSEKRDVVNQPSKSRRVMGAILNTLFYLILTISIVFVFLFGMYRPDGTPRVLFGHSIMRVATGSMSPELPINTLIVTRSVDPEELEVGDIVTFIRFNETIITHRIYEIYDNYQNRGIRGFRLIGDANGGEPDHEVHPEQNLVGRVVLSNYLLGQSLMFIYHQFLWLMVLVISALIALFLFRRQIVLKSSKRAKA